MTLTETKAINGKWRILSGTAQEVTNWLDQYSISEVRIVGFFKDSTEFAILIYIEDNIE